MTEPAGAPARKRSVGLILAMVAAGIVGVALAIAAIIGVGYLFFLLFRLMLVAIGHAIVEAIKQAFSGKS